MSVASKVKYFANSQKPISWTSHIRFLPGSIWHASYVLSSCMKDFPSDTLFMVVVDPGVGTHRECILGRIGDYTVLCPNNGILSHSLLTTIQTRMVHFTRYSPKTH